MSQTRRNKARARVFFETWPEDRLIVWTCARSEAEAAARAVAAKRIAAGLHATERAFIPALVAPVLQTAAAQAWALVSLCPMAWILLACLVALVGAFGASDWWPLAPRLHPSAAGRSGCAQPAAAAACEPSSRRARSRWISSSRRRNRAQPSTWPWPLAMGLIMAGVGSCAAYQFAPAPTPSRPPNSPTGPSMHELGAAAFELQSPIEWARSTGRGLSEASPRTGACVPACLSVTDAANPALSTHWASSADCSRYCQSGSISVGTVAAYQFTYDSGACLCLESFDPAEMSLSAFVDAFKEPALDSCEVCSTRDDAGDEGDPPLVAYATGPCVYTDECVCSSNYLGDACVANNVSSGKYLKDEECTLIFSRPTRLLVHLFDIDSAKVVNGQPAILVAEKVGPENSKRAQSPA